jgi:hypothetical protein
MMNYNVGVAKVARLRKCEGEPPYISTGKPLSRSEITEAFLG